MQSPASSQERVLTLSVPAGGERHLTGSDIKKLTWPEYISLYEVRESTIVMIASKLGLTRSCC